LAIAATDVNDHVAAFSNPGPQVFLAAPGADIVADALGGGVVSHVNGTSYSAPLVSGAAAILLGIPGNGDSSDVIRQLETTARDLPPTGQDNASGFGLLQLDKALQLAVTEHPLPPTPTPTVTKTKKVHEEGDGIVGPTDTPEFAGGGAGFGAGGGAGSLTPTLTATSTSTATSTPTMTFTPTDTPTATPGAALVVKPTPPPAAVMPMPPMPWVAGFFLLAGLGLIGYALVLRRGGE
jgi:hypothetical protein